MVDRRVEQLEAEGVVFRVRRDDRDDLDELRADHDAVVLATGAQRHRDLDAAGPRARRHRARDAVPDRVEPARGAGLDAGADRRDRAARGDPRRRRHERRLPRLGAPRGLRVGGRDRARVEPPTERSPLQTWPRVAAPAALVRRAPRGRRPALRLRDGRVRSAATVASPALPRCRRRRDRGRPRADRGRVRRRRGRPRRRRSRPARRWPSTTTFAHPVDGVFAAGDCVRGADLIVTRDRRRPRVRPRGRPVPDGLDHLPFRDRPTLVHSSGCLNSSPLQTPSGRAASPTAPAPSRSRAAPPARCPSAGASRTEAANGKTSPEELIGAAHAACFSMALSHEIAGAGGTPKELDVTAKVTFVAGTGITGVALTVSGQRRGPRRRGLQEGGRGGQGRLPGLAGAVRADHADRQLGRSSGRCRTP